jgi:hypothetical protein
MALLVASVAGATSITYSTPSGSTQGGLPVSATATFVTGTDSLTITLTNLQANPTGVIQNLSDLAFVLSGGQTSGTLISSSGLERDVAANGTFTDGSTVATGWELETGSGLRLHVLGTAIGPAHTIIGGPDGSNVYSNANGSIAGNDPHNPFLAGTVTFNLSVLGVTAESTVTSATFSFGTTEGNNTPGDCGDCIPRVPEPDVATLFVLSGVLVAIFATTRRRSGTTSQHA